MPYPIREDILRTAEVLSVLRENETYKSANLPAIETILAGGGPLQFFLPYGYRYRTNDPVIKPDDKEVKSFEFVAQKLAPLQGIP